MMSGASSRLARGHPPTLLDSGNAAFTAEIEREAVRALGAVAAFSPVTRLHGLILCQQQIEPEHVVIDGEQHIQRMFMSKRYPCG
jgi:hypothetical protein